MSSTRSTQLSLLGLCAINLVASLDATALSVSIPAISVALSATSVQAFWSGTSFVLGSAVVQPVFAAFSNAFGRKAMSLLALAIFAAGTIICSVAPTIAVLIVGRTVQGVGGGGLLTMTYVVIADLYALKDRAQALAVISLVWLVGVVCGPIVGGGFTTHVTWRWIFWFVLPFVAISLVLIAVFLKTSHQTLRPLKAISHTDWVGTLLLVASLTSLLMAISWGGSLFAWNSWRTILPLVLGVVGLIAFAIYEAYVPSFPIIPLSVLRSPTAASAFLGAFVLGVVQFGTLYYLPLYYQIVKHYDPLISGLALLPQCLVTGPTTAATGVYITKTGKYRRVVWSGWVLLTLGCGLLILLDVETTIVQWIFINIVSGFGLGALFTSQSVAAQAATEDQHKAIVSGLTPFFRTIGQALGIVICGAVFQNAFRAQLLQTSSELLHKYTEQLVINSIGVEDVVAQLGPTSSESVELVYAYNQALHSVWYTLTAFAGAAGVLSLHIQQISLERPEQPQRKPMQPDDIEKSASTEPIVRAVDGNNSLLESPSIRPQASMTAMSSTAAGPHHAMIKASPSFSTLSVGQMDDMMEEARHKIKTGPVGVGDDHML